jgi:hypothetical protein
MTHTELVVLAEKNPQLVDNMTAALKATIPFQRRIQMLRDCVKPPTTLQRLLRSLRTLEWH